MNTFFFLGPRLVHYFHSVENDFIYAFRLCDIQRKEAERKNEGKIKQNETLSRLERIFQVIVFMNQLVVLNVARFTKWFVQCIEWSMIQFIYRSTLSWHDINTGIPNSELIILNSSFIKINIIICKIYEKWLQTIHLFIFDSKRLLLLHASIEWWNGLCFRVDVNEGREKTQPKDDTDSQKTISNRIIMRPKNERRNKNPNSNQRRKKSFLFLINAFNKLATDNRYICIFCVRPSVDLLSYCA